MNTKRVLVIVAAGILCPALSYSQRRPDKSVPSALEAQVKQFFTQKTEQAHALAKIEQQEQAPEVWDFFAAGENGDWQGVANLYRTLRRGAYQYEGGRKDKRLVTMVWQPVNECFGAYEECANMSEKYSAMFAREILDSIPRGSIYFGGTDPGRWLPTAFSKSHSKADPCFTLTQNALADGLYLKYLRTMYGDRIYTPTDEDSQKAFSQYLDDAKQRLKDGKLKPGEDVRDVDGKIQVSGQVAVMSINALLAKKVFDANPRKEFFIEESFPLDWMYPHLSPHGLIMKITRTPLKELPKDAVQKDQEYWKRFTDGALGKWLSPTTSVDQVCDFATTVFENKEAGDYGSDEKFVRNDYACKTFSKLRSSMAGVYAWRAKHSASPEEKQRMGTAADFAFRQAFALCPYSPEAVFRYVNLLVDQGRKKDALKLIETAEQIDPRNSGIANLHSEVEQMK
jgi:hypothetical protein